MQTQEISLSITTQGLVIAIAVLVILILGILLLRTTSRRKKAQSLPAEKQIQSPKDDMDDATLQVVLGTAVALAMEQSAQEQLIAVLTAAVSAVWDGDGTFVVRRVRRIQTSPAWQKAGREEQIYSRM